MKKTIILIVALLNSMLYAESMEMIDTNGTTYRIEANEEQFQIKGMEGKVVFLEFFGLQCPACKEIMPNLIKIQEKYPKKLKIMAIEVQNNDVEPINKYKKQYGINYTCFSNYDVGLVVRYIADNSDWRGAIPLLMVIDHQGEVKVLKRGVISFEELEEYVKAYSL